MNQNGVTGLNVEPKNPKALADVIRFICENPEIYIKMSKNALKRFEEEFTIEKEILRILEIYNKLLEDKR